MCLQAIDRVWEEDHPYRRTKFAWKVFEVRDGRLYGANHHTSYPYALSEWHRSSDGTIRDLTGLSDITYPAGFHSFEHEKDAKITASSLIDPYIERRYVYLKVKIRDILVKGKDGIGGKAPTFVSRQLYILRPKVGMKNL